MSRRPPPVPGSRQTTPVASGTSPRQIPPTTGAFDRRGRSQSPNSMTDFSLGKSHVGRQALRGSRQSSSEIGRAGRAWAGRSTRPQSAQSERQRFSLGPRGSYHWEEIPLFPDSRPRFSRNQTRDGDETENIFSYRAALGGFGLKPDMLEYADKRLTQNQSEAEQQQDCFDDDASDAGSIFSDEEGRRREREHNKLEYKALLPGYEVGGNPREKAHLRRIITSADNLFPARYCLKQLGVDKMNGLVYSENDPSKLLMTLTPDIHTGLWSCCRKTNPLAPGCACGTHSTTKFLCTRCGAIYDTSTRKDACCCPYSCYNCTQGQTQECFYHPGSINRSRAGGVWWTCCGAVGFKNSVLHSTGGDLWGPQDFRWGCKRDKVHVPLSTFDQSTNEKKYLQSTHGVIHKGDAKGPQLDPPNFFEDLQWVGKEHEVSCTRIASISCVAQPLIPIILGIQLQYEFVKDLDVADGDRYVGNPGPISDRDHLRKIREEKLVLGDDEYIVEILLEYNQRNIQLLTIVTSIGRCYTFFEKWKLDNDEKSLKEMQSSDDDHNKVDTLKVPEGHRVVGLRYGLGDTLKCLGIITQRLVTYDPANKALTGAVARCTLCANFYIPPSSVTRKPGIGRTGSRGRTSSTGRTESASEDGPDAATYLKGGPLQETCKFHSGFWTPQRRVRVADNSTLPKCGALCEARNCGKYCNRYEHRSHVMVHSCGENRCAEICDMEGCVRRCSTRDHFHSTNDPMAIHTCGGAHPCKTPCVCGKKCKFVAARGEAVHTWHWCGSEDGCSKRCSVVECTARCINPNHHHHLDEDCFHHCGNEHPCLELCSAEGCASKCKMDREKNHKHACHNPHKLGCRCQCSIDDCVELCVDPDHFHADITSHHKCGEDHPCRRLCSAPGCKSACALSRENPHDVHECNKWEKLRCASGCSVPNCVRPCANVDHFHGTDLVEVYGKMQPKVPHLCSSRHLCGKKCAAFGCLSSCTVDKAVVGHKCLCDGLAGCRHACWFSTQAIKCRNFCGSSDHCHESEFHLCGKDHGCKELCKREEPCIWEGGAKKRQRKFCTKWIPGGQITHEGEHDCAGKHARPVEFSHTDDAGIRCTARCDKSGCRRRCRFEPLESAHTVVVSGCVMHVCEEVMCLELCPYPKCKKVCTLDHQHTIVYENSKCGCCPLHRQFLKEEVKRQGDRSREFAAFGDDTGGDADFGASSSRATRMIAQMKLAHSISDAKASNLAKGQRPLQTKRAAADTVAVSSGPVGDRASQPYYHGWGVNVQKYGSHFKHYSGMAPLERDGFAEAGVPGAAAIRPQPLHAARGGESNGPDASGTDALVDS